MQHRQLGRYALLEQIGRGGMGEVFRARDMSTDTEVALKVLSADVAGNEARRVRFRREARAAAMLHHPGIARMLEFGEATEVEGEEPTLYLAMELAPGEDPLRRFSVSPPDADAFIDLIVQLASAVESAHAAGVIHRDLKPANVKIDNSGRVKILDFGLAMIEGEGQAGAGTTARGRIVGTTPYLAPELFQGASANASSDLFSLGVLLYQTFTGRLPFSGASMIDYLHDIATRRPDPMDPQGTCLPPEVERIVGRLLSRDPLRRYASASDLLNDLHQLSAPLSSGAAPAAPLRTGGPDPSEAPTLATPIRLRALEQPPQKRRRVLLLAVIVGVLAALALAVQFL